MVLAHLCLQGICFFFFSGRLALRRRGPIAPSVTPSCLSLVGSDSRVYRLSKKVGAFPLVDARLPWSTSHFPQVIRASGRAQSVGSSVVHPGTCRVSVSSCFPAAESSRSFGQPLGFGSILQASLAVSSVALPSILKCSSVGLSFVVVSADFSNQGSMCSWGVSGSVPRWVTLPPPPPLSLVMTSFASQTGWGAFFPRLSGSSGTWSQDVSLVHFYSLELKAVFLAL